MSNFLTRKEHSFALQANRSHPCLVSFVARAARDASTRGKALVLLQQVRHALDGELVAGLLNVNKEVPPVSSLPHSSPPQTWSIIYSISFNQMAKMDETNATEQNKNGSHLLDLPLEILIPICEAVSGSLSGQNEGYYAYGFEKGKSQTPAERRILQDIKNCRLVCRQFCAASSHLVLARVCVDPSTPSTIDHLEEIARSRIAKGITTVCISLSFFNDILANDFASFVHFKIKMLNMQLWDRFRDDFLRTVTGRIGPTPPTWREVALAVPAILASQRAPIAIDPDTCRQAKLNIAQTLSDLHQEYQGCWRQQALIMATFVRRVGDAIASMPHARHIQIHDNSEEVYSARSHFKLSLLHARGAENILRCIKGTVGHPVTGQEGQNCSLTPNNYQVIPELLSYLAQKDVRFRSLDLVI